MKTHLLITVDCGKTTCDECFYTSIMADGCSLFDKSLLVLPNDEGSKRCSACRRAETAVRPYLERKEEEKC